MKISIDVVDEMNLYNKFDRDGLTLSEDVISYIISKAEVNLLKDKIEIELISKEAIDENKFIAAFNNYIEDQSKILKKEDRLNLTKQIWMSIIGVIFIAMSISLSIKFDDLILEVISTIGSFALWEAANSWLLERKSLKLSKIHLIKLSNSEIRFLNKE